MHDGVPGIRAPRPRDDRNPVALHPTALPLGEAKFFSPSHLGLWSRAARLSHWSTASAGAVASWVSGSGEGEDVRVLIVEDEPCIRDTLTELFDVPENSTHAAATLTEAQQALAKASYDLIVTDLRLGDRHDGGLQVLGASGLLSPEAAAIVLTAFPSPDNRLACGRLGATHFLPKPTDLRTIASLAWRHGVTTTIGRPERMSEELGELARYDR